MSKSTNLIPEASPVGARGEFFALQASPERFEHEPHVTTVDGRTAAHPQQCQQNTWGEMRIVSSFMVRSFQPAAEIVSHGIHAGIDRLRGVARQRVGCLQ